MIDLRTLHPLVLLGGKLALLFVLLPVFGLIVRFVLGAERDESLAGSRRRARGGLLALGAGLPAAILGFDLLDPHLVPAAVAASPVARAGVAGVAAALAVYPALSELRAGPRDDGSPDDGGTLRNTLLVILVLALLPATFAALLRQRTGLGEDPLDADAIARAPLRAVLVPSDADAHLGLAYVGANRDELARASVELRIARALHVDPAAALEVDSELAARGGDCPRAVRLFREALRARMPTDPTARLTLGGFHLPTSLVTRCDYASGQPR